MASKIYLTVEHWAQAHPLPVLSVGYGQMQPQSKKDKAAASPSDVAANVLGAVRERTSALWARCCCCTISYCVGVGQNISELQQYYQGLTLLKKYLYVLKTNFSFRCTVTGATSLRSTS